MRTTITLNDEAAEIAGQYAQSRNISLSRAINELIMRSTGRSPKIVYENGLPVFDVPASTRPITTQHVRELEDEDL